MSVYVCVFFLHFYFIAYCCTVEYDRKRYGFLIFGLCYGLWLRWVDLFLLGWGWGVRQTQSEAEHNYSKYKTRIYDFVFVFAGV